MMEEVRERADARLGFRRDINGLRALAVLLVVFYHFGIGAFRGGFVGVDVFFVISGFLMTSLIWRGIEGRTFSLFAFYLQRGRRIIPALAVLCVVELAAGPFMLTPPDLATLGRHVAASLGFVSNYVYLHDFGYFNSDNFDKWLVHTWSLSVEWQFYLLFPIVLLACCRSNPTRPRAFAVLALLLGASLAASAIVTARAPLTAFYLLPTRAWEMLAGGLVFLLPAPPARAALRTAACVAGLALVLLATGVFRTGDGWPGLLALLPVVGAAMVIWASNEGGVLLGNPAAQFLGRCSYSIYLWHWPVIVWLHHEAHEFSIPWRLAGIAGAVVLGAASHAWVERPALRMKRFPSLGREYLFYAVALALVITPALYMAHTDGLPGRANVQAFAAADARVQFANGDVGWCHVTVRDANGKALGNLDYQPRFSQCDIGDLHADRTATLFGDSHAAYWAPYVSAMAQEAHVRVRQLTVAGCKPFLDETETGGSPKVCMEFRRQVRAGLKPGALVVLAARWEILLPQKDFGARLRATLQTMQDAGAEVIIFGQSQVFLGNVGQRYLYRQVFDVRTPDAYPENQNVVTADRIVHDAAQGLPHVRYVNPGSAFCQAGQCSPMLDGVFAYYDDNHLDILGAQALARRDLLAGRLLFEPSAGVQKPR